jgi:hypothetical protein
MAGDPLGGTAHVLDRWFLGHPPNLYPESRGDDARMGSKDRPLEHRRQDDTTRSTAMAILNQRRWRRFDSRSRGEQRPRHAVRQAEAEEHGDQANALLLPAVV